MHRNEAENHYSFSGRLPKAGIFDRARKGEFGRWTDQLIAILVTAKPL